MSTDMNRDLGQNLRLLCSYYKSIAEVCRRLEVNRPQFNRYLSGRFRPAAHTLRRFCDFFGVEVHEILLPHDQFRELINQRPAPRYQKESNSQGEISQHLARLNKLSAPDSDRYLGYYYEYYLSMSMPGKVLCNLVCIEQQGQQLVYQRTERMSATPTQRAYHNVYKGLVWLLSDRLFLCDYETLNGYEITQTVLFPSFKNRITRLTGLKLGVADNSERMPCSTRVLYEFLGTDINVRKVLKRCGVYEIDAKELDDVVIKAVKNDIQPDEVHFRARY